MSSHLTALPGASADPGSGTVVEPLVDRLLADSVALDTPAGLAAHRDHRAGWYGDVVGPLRVPVSRAEALVRELRPRDHGLEVVLVAGAGEEPSLPGAREAMESAGAHVVGVELALPPVANPSEWSAADAASAALAGLALSVAAALVVPPDPFWLPALDVLADDGAETVAVHLPPDGAAPGVASLLRRAVDRDLACTVGPVEEAVTPAPPARPGALNLLCGVRAALNGAAAADVEAILVSADEAPLAAAARRMSDADAAVVRAFLPSLWCPSIHAVVTDLEALGLLAPDAA